MALPLQPIRYPTLTTLANTPTQLTARNFNNATYQWNPSVGLSATSIFNPVFNYDRQTEYTITIALPTGCVVVDTQLVKIEALQLPIKEDIFVPKAWSPNKDGHNDKLFPFTLNIRELRYFKIFNRWGELVYQTNIIGEGWDGIYKGKMQVLDVYTWTAEAVGSITGKIIKRSGNSVLLK